MLCKSDLCIIQKIIIIKEQEKAATLQESSAIKGHFCLYFIFFFLPKINMIDWSVLSSFSINNLKVTLKIIGTQAEPLFLLDLSCISNHGFFY